MVWLEKEELIKIPSYIMSKKNPSYSAMKNTRDKK